MIISWQKRGEGELAKKTALNIGKKNLSSEVLFWILIRIFDPDIMTLWIWIRIELKFRIQIEVNPYHNPDIFFFIPDPDYCI
jgi:hypothetical protein